MQSLKEIIAQLITQSGADRVGLVARDCSSSRGLWIHPDASFHPASTFKIAVMMEIFRQADEDAFTLDEAIPVVNEFRSIVDGSPYSLSAADDSDPELYDKVGQSLPIRDLTERMITQSSNLATNILIERVTPEQVTRLIRKLGTKSITVRRGVEDNKAFALGLNNAATARGLAHVLRRLALGQVVSPEASEAMLAILKRQRFNEGIPSGLPAGVMVAHKTGWNGKLYHDAAIIYPPGQGPYILVILTRGLADDREAPALVSEISKMIYDRQDEWLGSQLVCISLSTQPTVGEGRLLKLHQGLRSPPSCTVEKNKTRRGARLTSKLP